MNLLVVDDDDDIRYAIGRILSKCGCEVTEASSVELALDLMITTDFDVIFSDMRFSGGATGEELLKHVELYYPHLKVVMMSCSMGHPQQELLISQGAAYCLQKPFFRDTCITVLETLGQDTQKAA